MPASCIGAFVFLRVRSRRQECLNARQVGTEVRDQNDLRAHISRVIDHHQAVDGKLPAKLVLEPQASAFPLLRKVRRKVSVSRRPVLRVARSQRTPSCRIKCNGVVRPGDQTLMREAIRRPELSGANLDPSARDANAQWHISRNNLLCHNAKVELQRDQ